MAEIRIAAHAREEFGKGAARRVRRAGRVPAVLYGHGTQTRHLTLPGHDLMMALKSANVLLRLEGLPDGAQLSLPKAVQRDPIKGFIEHVDLILVRRGEKVVVEVPVQVKGEAFPGGLLDQQMVSVSVEADATRIPQMIEANVEGMRIGQAIHAGDLSLPQGVTLAGDAEALVAHILAAPTAEQIEAEIGGVPPAEEAAVPTPQGPTAGAEATPGQSG